MGKNNNESIINKILANLEQFTQNLSQALNPDSYQVIPVKRPSQQEIARLRQQQRRRQQRY